jgi:WD40-like Beta Propeller Repeat
VFLRVNGQSSSEITGPAFNPAGNRMYFSSQRGTSGSSSGGITYCVTGPFRT